MSPWFVTYGNDLEWCSHFLGPWEHTSDTDLNLNLNKVHDGFRDVVDSEKRNLLPPDQQNITSALNSIPITSADAERGFRFMNITAPPLRNRLAVP